MFAQLKWGRAGRQQSLMAARAIWPGSARLGAPPAKPARRRGSFPRPCPLSRASKHAAPLGSARLCSARRPPPPPRTAGMPNHHGEKTDPQPVLPPRRTRPPSIVMQKRSGPPLPPHRQPASQPASGLVMDRLGEGARGRPARGRKEGPPSRRTPTPATPATPPPSRLPGLRAQACLQECRSPWFAQNVKAAAGLLPATPPTPHTHRLPSGTPCPRPRGF